MCTGDDYVWLLKYSLGSYTRVKLYDSIVLRLGS